MRVFLCGENKAKRHIVAIYMYELLTHDQIYGLQQIDSWRTTFTLSYDFNRDAKFTSIEKNRKMHYTVSRR